MDNTKTAEEKPLQEQVISVLGLRLDDEGKEMLRKIVLIVDQREAPLKKRIEELESCGMDILKFKASLIRIVEMKFDGPSECSAAFERLSQLLNPSTNGK